MKRKGAMMKKLIFLSGVLFCLVLTSSSLHATLDIDPATIPAMGFGMTGMEWISGSNVLGCGQWWDIQYGGHL